MKTYLLIFLLTFFLKFNFVLIPFFLNIIILFILGNGFISTSLLGDLMSALDLVSEKE